LTEIKLASAVFKILYWFTNLKFWQTSA